MLRGQAQAEHVPETLQQLVAPHIDSFNYFVGEGMAQVVQHLPAAEVRKSALGGMEHAHSFKGVKQTNIHLN
jgi:hypothetical protein